MATVTLISTGTYCVAGVQIPCPAGRWGNPSTGSTTECPNVCVDGYTCPAGSTAQSPCGSIAVYCSGGTMRAVPLGMYSTPEAAPVDVRTGIAPCPMGSYCVGGARTLCAPGRFGSAVNLTSSDCSGQCAYVFRVCACCAMCIAASCRYVSTVVVVPAFCAVACVRAGYVCAGSGNTNSTAVPCGGPSLYCPIGSTAAVTVTVGFYSTGGSSSLVNSAEVQCEPGTVRAVSPISVARLCSNTSLILGACY